MGCVYQARNRLNAHAYIGITKHGLAARRREHERLARNGSELYFHKALRKYGPDAFVWCVLFESSWEEELNGIERTLIDGLGTKCPAGYNLTDGGDGVLNPSREVRSKVGWKKGRHFSAEHRAKIGRALRGQKKTPEQCAVMSAARTGRKLSSEHRASLSTAHKGLVQSEETRRKRGMALSGRKRPLEVGAKISAAKKGHPGRKWSSESRAKLSATLMGHEVPSIVRSKISVSNKGRKRSTEARAKMSRAASNRKSNVRKRAELQTLREERVHPKSEPTPAPPKS